MNSTALLTAYAAHVAHVQTGPESWRVGWIALGFILVAVAFLTRAEKKRTAEMKQEEEKPQRH